MPDKHPNPNPLSETDASLARVTEDLINLLVERGVIRFTDLPQAAQDKLLARQLTRSHLANSLRLLSDEGEDGLL